MLERRLHAGDSGEVRRSSGRNGNGGLHNQGNDALGLKVGAEAMAG